MKVKSLLSVILLIIGAAQSAYADCGQLHDGIPRGIQCLHCLDDRAKNYTPLLIDALIDTCQKNIAVGFLVDGSFGYDEETIINSAKALIEQGRNTYIHLYLLNGPGQRRWEKKIFNGFLAQMSPREFSQRIAHQRTFRRKYQKYIQKFDTLLTSLSKLGAHISISPMLEDNLSNENFTTLLTLTKQATPNSIAPTFVRSVCPDCFPGNQSGLPAGVKREAHTSNSIRVQQKNGIISNDGWVYLYFSDSDKAKLNHPVRHPDREETLMSVQEITSLAHTSLSNKNMFLLWISKYQQTLPGNQSKPVSKRVFPQPTSDELRAISEILAQD